MLSTYKKYLILQLQRQRLIQGSKRVGVQQNVIRRRMLKQ